MEKDDSDPYPYALQIIPFLENISSITLSKIKHKSSRFIPSF